MIEELNILEIILSFWRPVWNFHHIQTKASGLKEKLYDRYTNDW